ncbi:hypothetical protein PC129_g923 [Phytophthora cactorum]|uniref:Uncharacterized protein n=1 Tax=Phytophthora cactorum TaxID=29920 RepID=A0A329SZ66_9STRA|nr:hypothetical protein Pcac1_g26092 [Phytophthora cactorum]KAG2843711.1 hypothetical protein PC112_g2493 [Phytophthora cactorum]KAG2844298.1 hypothetical protein PC111_g2013 [Phytophthora cactorum]KAG2866843.1 hypothetical protein PC113_g2460 [Phytophthora cactorum]KAG2927881.1 hypothetical protein PC114_g3309 [Phytophthora cactorum]
MRGITGRLERQEESQTKLEKKIVAKIEHEHSVDVPMTPPMYSSLFASQLGRGAKMHIGSLDGSPSTPLTGTPRRAAVPPRYFGPQPPGHIMPLSDLQHKLHSTRQPGSDPNKLKKYLGSVFLEWGRRFERQVSITQSTCGFL